MDRFSSYMICTSPRSGSTLLCGMLASTHIAGKPDSYFFGTSLEDWQNDLEIEWDEKAPERNIVDLAVRTVLVKGRNGTDTFGLRMQWHSFEFFLEKLAVLYPHASTDAERIHLTFGTTLFLYLNRPNKLEQAVSLLKAQQTGLWHRSADGAELERTAPHREPVYSTLELQACVEEVTSYDRNWNDWFMREGIEPVRLSYDDLSVDPEGTLRVVLESVGLDRAAASGVMPTVKRLADSISDEWITRFCGVES